MLEDVQRDLLQQARTRRDERIVDVATVDDAVAAVAGGWARVPWSVVRGPGEQRLAGAGITVRCLQRADGSVPTTPDDADQFAYCARAY